MSWDFVDEFDPKYGPFYFDTLWRKEGLSPGIVVIRVNGQYFIGPDEHGLSHSMDVGPYDCLEDAQVAIETMVALKEFPKKWGFKE